MSDQRPAWPAVTHEDVSWDVHLVSGMPRADRSRIGTSYRAAVPPAIADLDVPMSGAVAAEAEEAALVTAAFDAELGERLEPYAGVLLRSESAASSQIGT